jgi:hypothetical protein
MGMWQFRQSKSVNKRGHRVLVRLGMAGGVAVALALGFALWPAAYAQTPADSRAQPMITAPVNESSLVTLRGNTRPEAKNLANDRGRVDDSLPLDHMQLQLRRPAAQEQALTALIDQLHDPNSPNYHQWLTAAQFGAQFGPAASDISAVTGWLQRQGFTVNSVATSGMVIDFSGTAGQVRTGLHTEIHNLSVKGVAHIANVSDPQIPAALAPAVVGIVSLHDFRPQPMVKRPETHQSPGTQRDYTLGSCTGMVTTSTCTLVTPADLATIYNFNSVFSGGNTGQGQSIYIIEDTDLYSTNDWTKFRETFGLSIYAGATLSTVHPAPTSGPTNCSDPGFNTDDSEAIIDAEWASAAAPSAAIVMSVCANTDTTFGGLIAIQNLVNGTSPPAIISLSYGECEAENGASGNAAYYSIYQQGVAEGTSIYVSAGDSGPDICDRGQQVAFYGINVSGFASTPYNVAVGGTDFYAAASNTESTYWNASNTSTYGSAKSYIAEMPWNGSCGSLLIANHFGYAETYGPNGFCSSAEGDTFWDNRQGGGLIGGSGGPSNCATGTYDETWNDGTCTGWPKPSWQTGFIGIQSDGVRDLPDVSLFASNGIWNAYYLVCFSDPNNHGIPCTDPPAGWYGAGGTSFGAPIWAGIQALVNQSTGSKQGLPNTVFYQLATNEYGAGGNSACNSANGNGVSSTCIFYDVTLDSNILPCFTPGNSVENNCYTPDTSYIGALSTSDSTFQPAYNALTGWDFATGIGTVNVANLVSNWISPGGGTPGLTVSVTGSGTVTSNTGGISCPSTCSAGFSSGTQVTLTATPASGSTFSSWSGACSGSGSCVVTMNTAKSVTATFTHPYTLSVSVTGSGSVTSSPPGISCGSTCSASFAAGTQVTLTATPVSGNSLTGWGGACGGTGSCVITMSAAQNVSATFTAQTSNTLSVRVFGNGTVSSSPSGISNCGSTCNASYTTGTNVTLTATPAGGATFKGWGGACSGTGTCTVAMNAAEGLSATFSSSGGSPSSRTWVSAVSGNDSNACTQASPCLTFAGALANTTAGGEIVVLTPGDYGAVTITQAVSIYNDGTGVAGALVSGASGIVIQAGASDDVNLRGLTLDGGNASSNGVLISTAGRVSIQNCVIQDFSNGSTAGLAGVNISPTSGTINVKIENSTILRNNAGVFIKPVTGAVANVSIDHSRIDNNSGAGVRSDGTGGGTVFTGISDSSMSQNAANGVIAITGPGSATVNLMRDVISSNAATGIQSNQTGGGTATVTVGSSQLFGNATGVQSVGGGALLTSPDNQVSGNTTNGSFTGNAVLQ